MSEENSMDVPETEASTSAVKAPIVKRATGRARQGQRARKRVTVMKDDDDEEQFTSIPGCGWERIYQHQPGKPEEYMGAFDEDMVLNIASDCLSTLKLISDKQRNSAKGAATFGPKKEGEKKAGSSTPKVDSSTKKKSKLKRTVIESRSPSPRPRTPNANRRGDDSDGDIFIDDLFSTDSEAEAKKAKEQEEKTQDALRRKAKQERRKEKDEKKKAKEDRRREKEERQLDNEAKLNERERIYSQSHSTKTTDERQQVSINEANTKSSETTTSEPNPIKSLEKPVDVVNPTTSIFKENDLPHETSVIVESKQQENEESVSIEVSPESAPVVEPSPCEVMETYERAAGSPKKNTDEANMQEFNKEAHTKNLDLSTSNEEKSTVKLPTSEDIYEDTHKDMTACQTPKTASTGLLAQLHAKVNTVAEGTKTGDKPSMNTAAELFPQFNATPIKLVVSLLSEDSITKLRSSVSEPIHIGKEEMRSEKAIAKRSKNEDRIPRKRPSSPSPMINAKTSKKRSESPPVRFLQAPEQKNSKRIVMSESPPQSPMKSVDQSPAVLINGYESDAPEVEAVSQPQRKIPQKKVVEDRTCFTCKRQLMGCEEDWCDLLGSNSGYCSVQCIDDRVAHFFRAIGDPEFKLVLISRDNLMMSEGVALNQLSAFLRESPHYDILMPDKSRMPKKDVSTEAKSTKHMSKDSDALRFSFKKSMIDALTNRVSKSGSGKTFRLKDCKDIAERLELSLFKYCKLNVMNPRYKLWVKQFNVQVKDMKNKGFYHRILSGELSVQLATSLDPEKLAEPQYSALSDCQRKVDIPGLGDGTATNRIPLRKPVPAAAQPASSTLDALLGDGSDTTEQHQSHMFDANCRICCNNQKSAAVAEKKEQEERLKAKEDEKKRKELRKTLVGLDEDDGRRGDKGKRGLDDVFMLDSKDPLNLNRRSSDSPRYASDDDFAGGAADDDYQEPVPTNRDEDDGSKTPDSVGEIWAKRARAREESWRNSPEDKSANTKTSKESPWERPDIWRGHISMGSFSLITTMCAVSNTAAFEIRDNSELPAVIRIKGRISPVIVFDYLTELRTDFSKDVIVVRLERPVDPEEEKKFVTFFDDMTRKDRHLVVDVNDHQTIKDAYLMAVPMSKEAPAPLLPWRGPGLSVDHSDMIIGVFVRYKRQMLDIPLQSITEPNKDPNITSAEPESASPATPVIPPYNGPAPGLSALSASNISNLTSFVSKIIAARKSEPGSSSDSNVTQIVSNVNTTAQMAAPTSMPLAASFIQPAAPVNDSLIPTQFLNLFQQNREREATQTISPTKMPTIHPDDIHTLADLIMFIQSSTSGPKVIKGVVAKFIQNPMLTEQDKAVIRKKVFEKIQAEKMKKLAQQPAQGGESSPCVSVPDSEKSDPIGVPPPSSMPTGSHRPYINRPAGIPHVQDNHQGRDDAEEHRSFTPSDFDNCDRPSSFLDRADDLVEKLASSLQKSQAGQPVPEPQKKDEGQDDAMSDQADAGSSTANSSSNTPPVLAIATPPKDGGRPPEPPRESESEAPMVPKPPPPVPLNSIPPPPTAMSKTPSSTVLNIPPPPTAPVPRPLQGAPLTPPKIPPPPQRAVPLPLPKHLMPPAAPVLPHPTVVNAPPGPPPSIPSPLPALCQLPSSIAVPPVPPNFEQTPLANYMNGLQSVTQNAIPSHDPKIITGISVVGTPPVPASYYVAPPPPPSQPSGISVIGAPPVPPPFPVAPPPIPIVSAPPPPPPPTFRESHGSAGFGGLAPSLGGGKVEKYSMIDFFNQNVARNDVAPIPPELVPPSWVPDDGIMPGFGQSRTQYDPRYADDNVPRTPTPSGSDDEYDGPPEKIYFGGMLPGQRPGTNRLIFPGARVFLRPPSPSNDELNIVQRDERRRLKAIERRIKKAEETWKLEERKLRREKKDQERREERKKDLERIMEERKQNRERRESMEAYWQKQADRKKRREEREAAYPESVKKLGLGKLRKTCTPVAKNYRIRLVVESDGVSYEEAAKIVDEHHVLKTDEECSTDSDAETGVPTNIRKRGARGGRKIRERREAAAASTADAFDYSRGEEEERKQKIAYDRKRGHTTSSIRIAKMARALNVEEDDRFPDEVYDYDRDRYYNEDAGSPRGMPKPYDGYNDRSMSPQRRLEISPNNQSRGTSAVPNGANVGSQNLAENGHEDMDVATSADERTAAPPAQKAPYNTFTEMPTAKKSHQETTTNTPKPNAPYMQYNNPASKDIIPNDTIDCNYKHQRGGGQQHPRGGGAASKEPWRMDGPVTSREPDWSQDRGGDDWCDQSRGTTSCREYEGGYNDYDSFHVDYQRFPPHAKRGRGRGALQTPRGGRGRGKADTPQPRGGRGRGHARPAYTGPVAYDNPTFFGGPGPAAPYRPELDRMGYGGHGYADDYHGYDVGYDNYVSGYMPDGVYASGYGTSGRCEYGAPPAPNQVPAYSQQYEQPFSGYNASLAVDHPRNPLRGSSGYEQAPANNWANTAVVSIPSSAGYGSPAPKAASSNSLLMQPPPPPPPPPTMK